jgi:hypothetical protein
MNKLKLLMLTVFFTTIAFTDALRASTIYQCEQPDGTIEFSNQGCSKSNTFKRKKTYKHKKLYNVKRSRSYGGLNIAHLQNKILKSTSADEMEKHARAITDTVLNTAQKGQIRIACNTIASTYAKLARQFERRKRQGEPVPLPSAKMQMLFEEIMLAEATINTANKLDREITLAWEKYRSNRL